MRRHLLAALTGLSVSSFIAFIELPKPAPDLLQLEAVEQIEFPERVYTKLDFREVYIEPEYVETPELRSIPTPEPTVAVAAVVVATPAPAVQVPRVVQPTPPVGNVMSRIRGCESMGDPNHPGDPNAKNPTSTASGLFQILETTWEGARRQGNLPVQSFYEGRFDPVQNTIVADWLYATYGTTPWVSSIACWG